MSLLQRARASAVCVQASRLLCVQLRDPTTRVPRLFVPGGAIEDGETPLEAAVRETFEETGYRVRADPLRSCVAHYEYTWDGTTRRIVTHFFRAELLDPNADPVPVNDASYNEGVHWLELDALRRELGFHAEIFAAVSQLVDASANA
jgi:8-oxo-dGTP pyrophosphatase MutT (NUDIX family)